jgi:hypothetical protein
MIGKASKMVIESMVAAVPFILQYKSKRKDILILTDAFPLYTRTKQDLGS